MFTDDSAVVAHSSDDIQSLVDGFTRAASQFGLIKFNIKKTECLYQPLQNLDPVPEPTTITINREVLMQCYDFKYLGSTISNNACQDSELRYRMEIASAAFGKPQDRFWKNRHVSFEVKCNVYQDVVLSSLLCVAETCMDCTSA